MCCRVCCKVCCRVCSTVYSSVCCSVFCSVCCRVVPFVCCRVCCSVCSRECSSVCCSGVPGVLQCDLHCALRCVLHCVLQGCAICCRVVPCVAVERGRDHHHDDLTLQQRLPCVAAWCRVLQCNAYSPCTTCRVPSLPTHALLPLAVYPRPPLPRRQLYARFGLPCRGS